MDTKNEIKAKEIVSKKPFSTNQSPLYKDWAYDCAIEMASWKDEIIAKYQAICSKTAQMREMQKLYFKTRASGILEKSKQLEREVDTALTQLKDLTQPKQQSLTF